MKTISFDGKKLTGYDSLAKMLETTIRAKGLTNRNSDLAKLTIGLESLSASEQSALANAVNESSRILETTIGDTEYNEELTQAQQDAGVILLNAAGDPEKYHESATRQVASASDMILDPTSVDVTNVASQESYDNREIEQTLARSIAFNIGAARQMPFMEMFFPTITITPDQAGLTINVVRNMVHNHFIHDSKGLPQGDQFGNLSLIDALIDSSILENKATDIVPTYNDTTGVFDTEFGLFPVKVGNTEVDSGAFLFNTRFNLISASANAITEPFFSRDQTDTIDSMLRLKTVNLEVVDKNDVTSIIPLDVKGLSQTGFLRAHEGNDRDTTLNWTTDTITITGKTLDKNKNEAAALAELKNAPNDKYVVRLRMGAGGRVNLADGEAELTGNSVTVHEVYETVELADGSTDLVRIDDPAIITNVKSMFKSLKLRSFTLDARYANLNRRERGLMVRQQGDRKRYVVPMTAPITALKPVTDTSTEFAVDAAVQTCRVSNTVAGIKALMEFDEMMNRYNGPLGRQYKPTDLNCVGIFSLRPYYERKTFDFMEAVGNLNSTDKPMDIASALCLSLRDSFAKAIQFSGWGAAQECLTGGNKETPTAQLICDPRVVQFLTVQGDNRLFGEHYKTKVETTDYLEFRNKIFMSVRREASVNEPDGLNFGNMFWIPELSTNLPIARSGQISQEFTIQPRRLHIVHCPILIRYDLANLDKVVDNRVPVTIAQ